jgi:hypothetical protein
MENHVCTEVGCFEEVSHPRWELGYRVCLECGEEQAQEKAAALSRQVAPAYNKGAYQLITSVKMCKDIGR